MVFVLNKFDKIPPNSGPNITWQEPEIWRKKNKKCLKYSSERLLFFQRPNMVAAQAGGQALFDRLDRPEYNIFK